MFFLIHQIFDLSKILTRWQKLSGIWLIYVVKFSNKCRAFFVYLLQQKSYIVKISNIFLRKVFFDFV